MLKIKFTLELIMGNWIQERAKNFAEDRDLIKRQKQLLANTDVWSVLRRQLEADIKEINEQDEWKSLLAQHPLKIDDKTDYCTILKNSWPVMKIRVINNLTNGLVPKIEVVTTIQQYGETSVTKHEQEFEIDSDGTSVFLAVGNERYAVPDGASQHLLIPIVEEIAKQGLKTVKSVRGAV